MKIPFEHFASGENLYTRVVAPVCEKHGLTYMEFTIVMFLANNPQFDTASQIVKIRHLTKSHVSVSARALQERGLLHGEYRNHDHRTVHLTLDAAAEPIIRDGRAAQKKFGEIIFEDFSAEERQLLGQYIDRIDENIRKHSN